MLSTTNLTKTHLPFGRAFLSRVKNEILGEDYELSLVFAGDALSRKLNNERRKKDKPANTLAFPLSHASGEIFMNMKQAKRDAPKFEESAKAFALRLFIHSCLHLKGFSHGSTMDSEEEKFLTKFL